MSYDDEYYESFSEDEVRQYLNIIGLDESDIKKSRLKKIKSLKLESISDLYELTDADNSLISSSYDVGTSYELLLSILKNDLYYSTDEEREKAKESAFAILNDVSCIQVSGDDDDALVIFTRTNELINTILLGISCAPNIQRLRMMQQNMDPYTLYKMSENWENDENLRKLYGLMALAQFGESEIDDQIFDKFDKISEKRIRRVIDTLIHERSKVIDGEENIELEDANQKRLLFRRPTFKELQTHGDYRRM